MAETTVIEESGGAEPQESVSTEIPGWMAGLRTDQKEVEDFRGYQKLPELADKFLELKKLEGRSYVPGEEASDEERSNYYKAIGVPDDPSEYELVDGVENILDPETIDAFKALGRQLGLTKSQMKSLTEFDVQAVNQKMEAMIESKKSVEAELRKEWGADFQKNADLAQQALSAFVNQDEEILELITSNGLGNNPKWIKAFHRVGNEILGEDRLKGGSLGSKEKPNAGFVVNYRT